MTVNLNRLLQREANLLILKKDDYLLFQSTYGKFKKIPNEQFANPVKNFKIKSYYVIIDTVFTQTQKRFDKSSTPLF